MTDRCRYCEKPLAYCRCGREVHPEIVRAIADAMMDEADQRKNEMDPGDTDLEWLFEKHFNIEFTDGSVADYPAYANHPVITQCMNEISDMVQGHHADKMLYHESPMKYYGLKESDFL